MSIVNPLDGNEKIKEEKDDEVNNCDYLENNASPASPVKERVDFSVFSKQKYQVNLVSYRRKSTKGKSTVKMKTENLKIVGDYNYFNFEVLNTDTKSNKLLEIKKGIIKLKPYNKNVTIDNNDLNKINLFCPM